MDKIGVVGGGTMGSGIAEVVARAGCDVIVVDVDDDAVKAAHKRVHSSVARGVRAGRLDEAAAASAGEAIRFTSALEDLADCELVIEAASENQGLKLDLFRRLDDVVADGAILA